MTQNYGGYEGGWESGYDSYVGESGGMWGGPYEPEGQADEYVARMFRFRRPGREWVGTYGVNGWLPRHEMADASRNGDETVAGVQMTNTCPKA